MNASATITAINTALAEYTDEVLRIAKEETEAEDIRFDVSPTGTYHVDSTGAVWIQITDHVNHGTTFWFKKAAPGETAYDLWAVIVVETLDEIEDQL